MKIQAIPFPDGPISGHGALVLGIFSGESLPEEYLSPEDLPTAEALAAAPSFQGKPGQSATAPLLGQSFSSLYLLGLGERSAINDGVLRSRIAELLRRVKKDGVSAVTVVLPLFADRSLSCAVAEGAELGRYSFDKYKKKGDDENLPELEEFTLMGGDSEGLSLGAVIARAQNFARDLANEPGNKINPPTLEGLARDLARDWGLGIDVWDEEKIFAEGMEGLYSVGMGSATPPRLVHLWWKPKETPKGRVAMVGKGITFDTGGLNLKPGDYIRSMKGDKSGACNVLAILRAAAELKLPLEVHGIAALAENMPGGKAFRPDDILRLRNGKTVEIDNTDAEGRLVLADALCYASELAPDVIIDMATLTGACAVALGSSMAGLFTSDDKLASALLEAGKQSGEGLWRLPEDDERIVKSMKSPVADLVNSGSRYGGAIFAARFLKEFVKGDIPWAHLDIAGVDFNKEEYGVYGKGASAFGVRASVYYLLSLI